MYEIKDFLKPYYEELEPKKRLEILNTLADSFTGSFDAPHASDAASFDADSSADFEDFEFLRGLYQDRYSDHEHKGREERKDIDWWLWRCLCLQVLYNKGNYFLYQKKYRDREVMVILNELHMTDTGEAHKKFLYHEYRNLARRYLSTCRDSGYASGFFGLKKATDQEKIFRACNDIWQMSEGINTVVSMNNINNMNDMNNINTVVIAATAATAVEADNANNANNAADKSADNVADNATDKSENKMSSLMSLWCKAFYDELMCFDPSCFEEYEKIRKKLRKLLKKKSRELNIKS